MKRWKRVMFSAVMAVLWVMTMALPALAADAQVEITAGVTLSGTLPDPAEEFTLQLRADQEAYPMPEGAKEGVYTLTVTGQAEKAFPAISYDRVGVYTYTISQLPGTNQKCTYDDREYALTVYVTNAQDGDGLEATAVLYRDDTDEKQSGIVFENEYETVKPSPSPSPTPTPPPTPTPTPAVTPKTGDETNPGLYVALMGASLGVILVLTLVYRAKRTKE